MLRRLKLAGLVATASGVAWGGLVRAIADDVHPSAGGPAPASLFELKRVAEGIYAAIARPTAMLNCNAAVVVNRDHVLVVDTHSKPSAARALIRQIRAEATELPVATWSTATSTATTPWATRPTPRPSARTSR